MHTRIPLIVAAASLPVLVLAAFGCGTAEPEVQPGPSPIGMAAVPGEKGGQDVFGAYEVVPDWPKPLSTLPGHDDWTYLDEWRFGPQPPSDIHLFVIPSDRNLWAADRGTSKILKYDLEGNFLYAFGTWGVFPGGFRGVHGMNVDQEGNLYVAGVDRGGAQKFRPRPGANPAYRLGAPVNPAR